MKITRGIKSTFTLLVLLLHFGSSLYAANRCEQPLIAKASSSFQSVEFFSDFLNQEFVDIESRAFLQALRGANSEDLVKFREWTGQDFSALELSAKRFGHKNGSEVFVSMKVGLFHNRDLTAEDLVIVGKFVNDKQSVVGYWARTLSSHRGDPDSYLDFIKMNLDVPESSGILRPFMQYSEALWAELGVNQEILSADWLGRLVWAREGYSLNPDYFYFVGGQRISQLQLMRDNFLHFLDAYGIALSECSIFDKSTGQNIRINSIEDLKDAIDFIRVVHPTRKISLRPYVDADKFGNEESLEVGKAYALSDNRPYEGQKIEVRDPLVTDTSDKFSDKAMPAYSAIRVRIKKAL